MPTEWNDARTAVLRALCDTYVPSIAVADDPIGFWARSASDVGVPAELARVLDGGIPPDLRQGLLGFLDALNAQAFTAASQEGRERMLGQLARTSPDAARAIGFYRTQVLLLTYGLPAEPAPDPSLITYGSPQGQNPNWEVLGYPGPISVPPQRPKQIETITPGGDRLTLEADVCVVGSGAGGSVIAARLAGRGYHVVILETGGHYNSADFHQLELWGYRHLWYGGGATPTADGNVLLLAGATLGGGTEINWMNCVPTPDLVRYDWERQYGLDGVDTPVFKRYVDGVVARLSASSRMAYYNAQNLRMKEGCERLGYLSKQTLVNWDPALFQPLMAGYTGFGDQTGGKQTARRTYLLDAYRSGARVVVHCRADRILVERGRAAGVEATYADPRGRRAAVTVRARQVVVACGAIESPALLLRSGIGGPAVGKNLRVQPGGAVYGVYSEKQKGWWGSPMTANCEEFTDTGDGFGFYMEIPAFGPGFVASVIPWSSGRQHKEMMTKVPNISTFIWFLRDKGCGEVTVDAAGKPIATYDISDETDRKNFRRASIEAVRIHDAAGAQEVLFSASGRHIAWKRGNILESYIAELLAEPLGRGAQPMISAHQLCTCRLGRDPATSVANPDGELRDVKGVWIGDGSACPTALGANPMVTIMALAERTADRMSAATTRTSDAWSGAAPDPLREIVGTITNPTNMLRMMMGMMTAPLSLLTASGRMGPAPSDTASDYSKSTHAARSTRPYESTGVPMFSHIIELIARPGCAADVVTIIRDQAIPQIIQHAGGFVDEIVLLSDTDSNRVTAISFWQSREDAEHFTETGFAQVSAMLASYLSAAPQRREFGVGASTNQRIRGWQ